MTPFSGTTTHLPPSRALLRFGLRTSILVLFAAFNTISFGRSLAALLWMTIILCSVIGLLRREPVLSAGLNHWDEMLAYTAMYCAVIALDHGSLT